MRARDLVGAIGAHDKDRELAQRIGERAEQLESGVVGPLQVVEQDHRGRTGRDRRQRAAQRLEQRGAVALRDRGPELGQQQGEMALQRAARGQRPRRSTQVAAQRAQHRAIGQRRRRARRAAQRQRLARRRDLLGQARLADPGLAGQQHQRALSPSAAATASSSHARSASRPMRTPPLMARVYDAAYERFIGRIAYL